MNLLGRLKAETSDLHSEIEQHVPLMKPTCTREDYRWYLEKLYGFYLPVEAHLVKTAGVKNFDISTRLKCDWLEQDLQALGADVEALSVCETYPRPLTVAELAGVMYVLEGSTLGGQVLMRMMMKSLDLSQDQMNFLAAYREKTGEMWNKFRTQAEEAVVATEEQSAAVVAAQNTFRSLSGWLQA